MLWPIPLKQYLKYCIKLHNIFLSVALPSDMYGGYFNATAPYKIV